MGAYYLERIAAGFTAGDWIFLLLASIVAALVMKKWAHLTGAVVAAFAADTIWPVVLSVLTGVPWDFALQRAFDRLDLQGAAAVVRLFIYGGVIAICYAAKLRYLKTR